ncbi:hypothetical protein JOF54_001790 [Microlunatus capsulatus]|uniref:Uncharacterized protein n=1 Tax=Microlunatus capsulatus TaxID=99117 RepID=A0ABS4Z745_9ACTN|nr:hypothetical protein [Microlunatus capsulatus]MBP2416868.1 hypothetical protein [Microlunatus capsulatus]
MLSPDGGEVAVDKTGGELAYAEVGHRGQDLPVEAVTVEVVHARTEVALASLVEPDLGELGDLGLRSEAGPPRCGGAVADRGREGPGGCALGGCVALDLSGLAVPVAVLR